MVFRIPIADVEGLYGVSLLVPRLERAIGGRIIS